MIASFGRLWLVPWAKPGDLDSKRLIWPIQRRCDDLDALERRRTLVPDLALVGLAVVEAFGDL